MNKFISTRYGDFIYPDKDTFVGNSLKEYGEYSYHEVEFLKSLVKSGDVVLDIGANIGAITVPLAKKIGDAGYMVAFEPQQHLHYILCGNIAVNNLHNTHAFQRIVCDKSDEIKTIPVFDFEKQGNFGSLSSRHADDKVLLTYPVKTVTVDSLQLAFANLIKIDVEGEELDVLEGARHTIERSKPYLYVECLDTDTAEKLDVFLSSVGYKRIFHQTPLFHRDNFFANKNNIFGKYVENTSADVVSGNFFCYPASEEDQWRNLSEQEFFFEDLRKTILVW